MATADAGPPQVGWRPLGGQERSDVGAVIGSLEAKQGLPRFDFLSRCHQHGSHGAIVLGVYFVEDLHRLDHAQRLACGDRLSRGDEGRVAGRRCDR